MADITWNGSSGDWDDAGDWTPAQVPVSGDNVTIAGSGSADILVSGGETVSAAGILLNNANATLEVDGLLNAGTIALDAGTIADYGTIAGATIVENGGSLALGYGLLQGDTIRGDFEIGGEATAVIQDGLTVESLDGTQPGTITIDGADSTLSFNDTETFDNATIVMGSADGLANLDGNGTLTLGPDVTVETAGTIFDNTIGGEGTIINQGTILADATSGTVSLESPEFVNQGVITATGGDILQIQPYGTFANEGTLTVGNGSTIAIQYLNGFTNTGFVEIQGGGELDLNTYPSALTIAQSSGGTVEIDGLLNAGGEVLNVGTDSAFSTILNYGTLEDATLVLNGGTLGIAYGLFKGDTIQGNFEIGGESTAVVQGGLTAKSLDGTQPGTITIDGADSTLSFNDTETFDNATIVMGSADGLANLDGNGTLTLGPDVTVETAGTIFDNTIGGEGTIINQGTILADATSGTVSLESPEFINQGVITATGGDILQIQPYGTFANEGTLTVGNGSTIAIQYLNGFTNTGFVEIQGGGELDLNTYPSALTIAQSSGGTVEIDGLLNAGGETLDIAQDSAFSTILNYGTLEDATLVLNGGTLGIAYGLFKGDTVQGNFEIGGESTAVVQGGLTAKSLDGTQPGTITIDGADSTLSFNDTETFDNATIVMGSADGLANLDGNGTLTLGPDVTVETAGTIFDNTIGGEGTIINQGTILADATSGTVSLESPEFINQGVITATGGDILQIQPYGTFANEGTLTVGNGSTIAIQYLNGVVNTGSIVDNGGNLQIGQAMQGAGGVTTLADDATASLAGTAAGQTVTFEDGTDSLTLSDAAAFAGTITGFQTGDTITLDGLGSATESYADGVLTITNGGTVAASLHVDGSYQANDFSTQDVDGNLVLSTDVLPCFAAGTRILTGRGEVPVEELREKDGVVTVTDGERRITQVTWLGHRTVDITRHPAPEKVRPVRVARGAFGEAMPARDLLLSPDHAVFAEGVLIPVKYLVNGTTIRFDETIRRVTYFHVELTQHEVLLAEGLPAESYLETGGRAMFENGGQPVVLYPDFSPMTWDVLGCAPLKVTGPEVETIRARLAARAERAAA